MRTATVLGPLLACVSLALAAASESPPKAGAKELFLDPYGNSVTAGPRTRRASDQGDEQPEKAQPEPQRVETRKTQQGRKPPGDEAPAHEESGRSSLADEAQNVGLFWWIELVRPGETIGVRVGADRVFKSGERVRLHFRSNIAGQIALIQVGTHGEASLLFPDASKGHADNQIASMQDRVLPSETAWFRFDHEPGVERLLVLFAQDPADLPLLASVSTTPQVVPQLVQETLDMGRSGKNLVLENEVEAEQTTGTYVVNLGGGPVIFELVLRHS